MLVFATVDDVGGNGFRGVSHGHAADQVRALEASGWVRWQNPTLKTLPSVDSEALQVMGLAQLSN